MARPKTTAAPTDPRDIEIANLRVSTEAAQLESASTRALFDRMNENIADLRERLKKSEADRDFALDTAAALERRLERAKGYIDRIIEGEEDTSRPIVEAFNTPPTARGPAISDIEMSTRSSGISHADRFYRQPTSMRRY